MKKVALFYEHLQIYLFKKGTAPDSTILFPIYRLNINKQTFDHPPLSPGTINLDPVTHIASTSERELF